MDIGQFDYINCCGVLHHLENPSEGLNALSSVLKDGGCMGVMVYARYGRTAIYQMQELMRQINAGEGGLQQRIENTRSTLQQLPASNWCRRDESRWANDLNDFGDIEIFDLFLHSQDRAYTIPQLYDWIENCNLRIVTFTGFTGQTLNYQPKKYIKDSTLLERIDDMPLRRQQAIAELLHGCIKTHTFYVSRENDTLANPIDMDSVPFYTFRFAPGEELYNNLGKNPHKALEIKLGKNIDSLVITQNRHTRFILRHIDGYRTVREIISRARGDILLTDNIAPDNDELIREYLEIFNKFHLYELMFVRNKNIPPYKNQEQLLEDTINYQR